MSGFIITQGGVPMSTKKKQCTKEFKSDAVKLVTEQGYSLSEAARNLGIAASTLGRWKRRKTKCYKVSAKR